MKTAILIERHWVWDGAGKSHHLIEVQCPDCQVLPMMMAENGWSAITCPDCKQELRHPDHDRKRNFLVKSLKKLRGEDQ